MSDLDNLLIRYVMGIDLLSGLNTHTPDTDENFQGWHKEEDVNAYIGHLKFLLACACENPWISVEDRLPETRGDYLVKAGKLSPFVTRGGDGHLINVGDSQTTTDGKYHHITHWMPIPELEEI